MSLPFQEYERIDLNGFPKKEKEMRFFFLYFCDYLLLGRHLVGRDGLAPI